MLQRPIVFIEKEFLLKLHVYFSKTLLEINNNHYITFLKELLFNKGKIYINISQDEITKILTNNSNNELEFLIKLISMSNDKLESINTDFNIINLLTVAFPDKLPTYVLANISSSEALNLNKKLGVIILSSDFDSKNDEYKYILDSISRIDVNFINVNIENYYKTILNKIPKPSKIYIEDPFLYTTQDFYFISLLNELISFELIHKFTSVYLIYSSKIESEETEFINKIKKVIDKSLLKSTTSINFNFINNKTPIRMHDRNILTNTSWITCTNSFKNKYTTPTQWTVIPIGNFYIQYLNRMNFIMDLIRSNDYTDVITINKN